MEINFGKLKFVVIEDKIRLASWFNNKPKADLSANFGHFVEVQIAGQNKNSHLGSKMINSSEGKNLNYLSHTISNDCLVIAQASEKITVTTVFKKFDDTNAIQVYSTVKNISDKPITLEEVSALVLFGLANTIKETDKTYIYKFSQSHHLECQPLKYSFSELGLYGLKPPSQKRILGQNVGSWSTKEELPQAIIEYDGNFTMFQLENNNSWYWEISDYNDELYLYLGGANRMNGWHKKLQPNDEYTTNSVCICSGNDVNSVVAEMSKYRRHIMGKCISDQNLPTIFNEYMHLSWDSPTEENTRKIAPVVASLGVKYYVIDCGWHNEEPGNEIYPYVGQWKESKTRFPNGVKKTTDYIRSLGMKAGLWIEPEIIGFKCQEMLGFYDDDCFIRRNGEKVCVMRRYFLDYRNKKVVDYMNETIRRMVEDYGADYIKMDYNQDLGIGTDELSDSFGEGLEQCSKAYLAWVDNLKVMFPNVLFETCSSGGMRMDYETLKHFSIISTSDQTNYKNYPYVAGNVLSAVLPEQAAVWSYPVDSQGEANNTFMPTSDWVEKNISKDQVVMNMINSFLGRMHLASHLELLSKDKLDLVKEGVDYYDSLTEIKKEALPYFPKGFNGFGENEVVAGLKYDNKYFIGVWCLGENKSISFNVDGIVKDAKIAYPQKYITAKLSMKDTRLTVDFENGNQAVFIECITK